MERNLDHLELSRWQEPLPRRKQGGGSRLRRDDQQAHGARLVEEAANLSLKLGQRLQSAPPGINPKMIFKIELHPQGTLSEDDLRLMGLHLLAKDARRAIVVFPDQPTLDALQRRLREYAGFGRYAALAGIEAITPLTVEDRTGTRLTERPLAPAEIVALDLELWHPGSEDECRRNIEAISTYLRNSNLSVTDSYVGTSLCVLRARLNSAVLAMVLSNEAFDFIREIERRPQPTFELGDVTSLEVAELEIADADNLPDDLVGVLIVDSGVMQLHPLLGPAIGDAQVFPGNQVKGGPEDRDQTTPGHGTAVAGIAVYGDVGQCIKDRIFVPSARLFSARVTDEPNEFDADELLEHQLASAVEYFLGNYPNIKVINISLGSNSSVYADGRYQFRFAAVIDELAYRYRDRNILFVVPTGNYYPDDLDDDEVMDQYPDYLYRESARIIDPATSALAITVGGLSYGAGHDLTGVFESRVDRPVAGERDFPAPFTRLGWGFGGAICPEGVDYAGDLRWERGRVHDRPAIYAGLPTTAPDFAPQADDSCVRLLAPASPRHEWPTWPRGSFRSVPPLRRI